MIPYLLTISNHKVREIMVNMVLSPSLESEFVLHPTIDALKSTITSITHLKSLFLIY